MQRLIGLIIYGILHFPVFAFAQQNKVQVIIQYAERMVADFSNKQDVRYLSGNVILRQDDVVITCDSAIKMGNVVRAIGEVIIEQSDTIVIFSDSVFYDGDARKARLMSEVVLTDPKAKLFTDLLYYDVNEKLATYRTGAIIESKQTRLYSKVGYYNVNLEEVYFKDSVIVADPEFSLRTDTLKIDTKTNITYFVAPTDVLNSDGSQIVCSQGFYDPQKKYAEFDNFPRFKNGEKGKGKSRRILYDGEADWVTLEGDATYNDGTQTVAADRIRYNMQSKQLETSGTTRIKNKDAVISAMQSWYDEATDAAMFVGQACFIDSNNTLCADTIFYNNRLHAGRALSNVVWQDTAQDLRVDCATMVFNDSTEVILAKGRPLLTTILDGDTLYLAANVLHAYPADTAYPDSARILAGKGNIKLFSNDLQAICDSMQYNRLDSVLYFFNQPVFWSDTTQFTGDTVRILLRNDNIYRVYVANNALIINTKDEIYFNQVKGNSMTAFFEAGDIRRILIDGSGESIYYIQNDAAEYVGVSQALCSRMVVLFDDEGEAEGIKYLVQPTAVLYPMDKADHAALRMKGFSWELPRRPRSVADLRFVNH